MLIFFFFLQNMAFQAEQKIKSQILNTLGTDQIFRLLSDPQVDVLMKTLGLLRNLLSTKPHIDHIMGLHGNQIMQVSSITFLKKLMFLNVFYLFGLNYLDFYHAPLVLVIKRNEGI